MAAVTAQGKALGKINNFAYCCHMEQGLRIIVSFRESDDLPPSPGKIVEQIYRFGREPLFKIKHDDGLENWYPESWVSPLLKPVKL